MTRKGWKQVAKCFNEQAAERGAALREIKPLKKKFQALLKSPPTGGGGWSRLQKMAHEANDRILGSVSARIAGDDSSDPDTDAGDFNVSDGEESVEQDALSIEAARAPDEIFRIDNVANLPKQALIAKQVLSSRVGRGGKQAAARLLENVDLAMQQPAKNSEAVAADRWWMSSKRCCAKWKLEGRRSTRSSFVFFPTETSSKKNSSFSFRSP